LKTKNKLYIFLSVAFIALIFMLGSWGLTDTSEARYAEIGKEMFVNGDFLNPTLLGIKHLHKPPVTYYLTTLGYQIFGINEFGARFFMQLAIIFQLLLVFKITLILYKNEKLAFAASLIYFSLPITIIAVRSLTTDAYLTTFILASIYFWLCYKQQLKPFLLYFFYLFLGLIFETKGPVGLIVPIIFVVTYKIINKDKIEVSIHQFFGFLLFLIVSASWYIAAINSNEGLFDYFFNNQLVERVSKDKFQRGKPFWYYLLIMPLVGLPWLFYLPFYFKKNIKTIIKHKKTDFVLLVSSFVFFIILSISTSKLVLYILPLYFIFAIFSAKYISKSSEKIIQLNATIYSIIILLFTLPLVILSFIDVGLNVNFSYALTIFIVFNGLAFLISKKILNTNYLKPAYLGVVFIVSIIMSANHLFRDNELQINSAKPIVEFIQKNSNNNSQIIVYNDLLPSLPFYLNEEIITIGHGKQITQREIQFETNTKWKKNYINYFDKNERLKILDLKTEQPTFFIKRKVDTLPDMLQIFANKFKNKVEFRKFEMYY
jgi:4-amino-4-deoxy-L-arabinose transferase